MSLEHAERAIVIDHRGVRDSMVAALERYVGEQGPAGRPEQWHDLPAGTVADLLLDAVAGQFPVESYRDAARHLRRPFAPNAVKFKVQHASFSDGWAMVVAHIDARLAVERLNLVCPHLWSDAYERADDGTMWCHLTIDDTTRRDVGEGSRKGLRSDAFKRAAVRFGVGVSLYALPKIWLYARDGHLKQVKSRRGPTWALSDVGDRTCRIRYAEWLEAYGERKFGPHLDHGDAEDAVGDTESTGAPIVDDSDGDQEQAMSRCIDLVIEAKERRVMTGRRLELLFTRSGATTTESVSSALRTMEAAAIDKAASELADLIAAADERRAAR